MSAVAPAAAARDGRFHPYLAAVLASTSGILMLRAGVALFEDGWAAARLFAAGGGVTIQAALFVERIGVRGRAIRGHGFGNPLALQLAASACILTAGMGLVGIGYYSPASGWWPLGLILVPILLVLAVAALLNRRAAVARAAVR